MNKTILAIAMGGVMASGAAFAGDIEVKDAYVGAEIGGNFLLGDDVTEGGFQEEGTFEASNMIKVGAEIGTNVTKGVDAFVATEVRYGAEGVDSDWNEGRYENDDTTEIHTFAVGFETMAGRTAFGIQEGMADTTDGFADLSMEHGLNANFGAAIDGDSTLEHTFSNEKVMATGSYDFDTEAFHVGATAKVMPNLEVGAAYVDGGDIDYDAYTLGAVYSLQKIDLAAKYAVTDVDNGVETTGYAFSGAYSLNDQVKLAASYNAEDYEATGFDGDDDWFTVGASYQVSKNVELVTDYKFASESDDQLFVRANLNF